MSAAGLLWIALALGGGVLIALQGPINAQFAGGLSAPLAAATVSLAVSAICGLALYVVSGQAADWRAPAPWLYAAGGCLGIVIVTIAIVVTPRLGAGTFLAAAILGQLATALVLDHFGLFGLEKHDISLGRLAAVALIFAGAILMRVF